MTKKQTFKITKPNTDAKSISDFSNSLIDFCLKSGLPQPRIGTSNLIFPGGVLLRLLISNSVLHIVKNYEGLSIFNFPIERMIISFDKELELEKYSKKIKYFYTHKLELVTKKKQQIQQQ